MTFLPIVERELRVASRRRGTYLGRLVGAVIAMAIGGWIMLGVGNNAPGQIGMILFVALSVMLFAYSMAAGARMTADCLSEEKREGTLGLLFLTDLKGYDIVAGKLVANSLNTFYGLLSAFPVLAISLLLGGVTSTEFWRVSLVAINLLFLSLSVGMFASAMARDERKGMSLAFLILLVLMSATPLLELSLQIADRHRADTTTLFLFSPGFSCFSAFGGRIPFFKPSDFWIPMAVTQLYAWIFLALASVIVPRSWQDKAARPIPLRNFWRKVFSTDRKHEAARRTRLLEINPFLWLSSRDPLKATFIWATFFILGAIWIWGLAKWPKDWLEIPNYILTAVTLHTILKFWLASEACNRFIEDRKNSALELLLSTPLKVEEILRGQRIALFRQFAGPVVFVLAVDFVFLILGLNENVSNQGDDVSFWVLMWLCGMFVFVMDMVALSWVSMWAGLTSKKINQAGNAAVGRILVLPWMAFLLSMTVAGTASFFTRINWDEKVFLFYWFALCIVNNLIFMKWAKGNLHTRFRDMATQRFAVKNSRFGWMKARVPAQNAHLPPVINLR